MRKIGFDSDKYLQLQSEKILERIDEFGGKLYIEFGGKLFDDFHASRVLPGFAPDNKIKMLCKLKDQAEIVIVINSNDIANNKIRADLGITYDQDVIRLIDVFRSYDLYVASIVLAQYSEDNEPAKMFEERLKTLNVKVYHHYPIKGYPHNVPLIVSDDGYGKNDYIETTRNLVIITAPGPGSGKMATCLSQLYLEHRRGNKVGYAKYETFPVWNLPLKHMVNLAYEAATADLNDVNMIDPWHLSAYGKQAVNYNRDVEIFPVLNAIFEQIMGKSPYKSPTDMGVNMAGYAICDDDVCVEASKQEIIRRYFNALAKERRSGTTDTTESDKIALIMKGNNISVSERKVYVEANRVAVEKNCPAAAIELEDGAIITGKTNDIFGCSSSMILNALKYLAGIPDEQDLISKKALMPIQDLKLKYLGSKNPRLHIDEMLIALSMSAEHDKTAEKAIRQLPRLKGCEVHTTVLLAHNDEKFYRKLGVNLTSNPIFKDKSQAH